MSVTLFYLSPHARLTKPGPSSKPFRRHLAHPDRRPLLIHLPPGRFKGERTFTLTRQDPRTTRFTMREEYSGLLLSLIWKSMPDLGPSLEQFAPG